MNNLPRRELDELLTRYEFHPAMFDVFVEGYFDHDLLSEFNSTVLNCASISVIPIDTIDVPNECLVSYGLPLGSNKSRVIALGMILECRLGKNPSNLACLVDADNDRVLNVLKKMHYVLYTDFTCMEMYSFNRSTLDRFFTLTCGLKKEHVDDFIGLAEKILPCQFVVRAVNESLGTGVAIPNFVSGLVDKRNIDSFDNKKYLKIFLEKVNGKDLKINASELFEKLGSSLKSDIRNKAHGHDFITLLFDYMWSKGGVKLHNKEDDVLRFGGRILASTMSFFELSNEPLFGRLRTAAAGKAFLCV